MYVGKFQQKNNPMDTSWEMVGSNIRYVFKLEDGMVAPTNANIWPNYNFTNPVFPEIRRLPLLNHHLGVKTRVRSRANLTRSIMNNVKTSMNRLEIKRGFSPLPRGGVSSWQLATPWFLSG